MHARREAWRYAALPALFLALFLAVPLFVVGSRAVAGGDGGFAEAARHLVGSAFHRNRIAFTFEQATVSTALTLLVGLPLAYLFGNFDFPGRRVLRALFTVPFVLPAIVVALALHAYLGPGGILGIDVLSALGPYGSIVLAHVFYNTSLVVRIVGGQWERLTPLLTEAARTLGAKPRDALWRLQLPLLRPSILAAALLVFVFDLTSFAVILLLGDDRTGTIETLIYGELRSFRPDYALASLLALLQLATTFAALSLFVYLQRRARVQYTPHVAIVRRSLPAWTAVILAPALLVLVGPVVALAAASLRFRGHWSVEPFRLLAEPARAGVATAGTAIANSLTYAVGTLVVALVLGGLAALALQRARGRAWTEAFLLLPLGLSSVVVGLGLLLSWDGRFLPDLRASAWRIVAAHTLIAFPFASRILAPALEAIPEQLREAARTLGAGPGAVARLIDLPLAAPAFGAAAVYTFGASLGEFGAALTLRRPETTTIPLMIHDLFARLGDTAHAKATALATLLLVVAAVSFLLLERLRLRSTGEFA